MRQVSCELSYIRIQTTLYTRSTRPHCGAVCDRSRRSESARRSVRQRTTAAGHRASADRRDGAPGRSSVRHLQTAARLTRMRQQDTRTVRHVFARLLFYPRDAVLARILAMVPCLCLSVRLSVCHKSEFYFLIVIHQQSSIIIRKLNYLLN